MNKIRTGGQDCAKGIIIISVIFFHCYLVTFPNHGDAIVSFNILFALFPYLLSAFFFYAGYNYWPNNRSFKENITRRAKQLLIPLVIALLISIVLISPMELIFHHDDPVNTLKALWNSVLYGLMSEPLAIMTGYASNTFIFELMLAGGLLWFLYALFICSIFFFLLVKHTNKSVPTLISVVLGLLILAFCLGQYVGTYLPFTVQCYPVILAIMLTAAHLRQHHFLNIYVTSKKKMITFGINMLIAEGIVVGICLACYYQFGATITGSLPGGQLDPHLKGLDAIIAYIFGIVGTYAIHTACRLIKFIPIVGKFLQFVGIHSATFYLFHPIFLDLAEIIFFQKKIVLGTGQAFIYVAFIVAAISLVCLLLHFIHKKRHPERDIIAEIQQNEAPENNY